MIPNHKYLLTLNTSVVEVTFIKYTSSGFFQCILDGNQVMFDTLTVIGFIEVQ